VLHPGASGAVQWDISDIVASASALGNPFAYTGQRLDGATGLYLDGARYYDPETGTFLSADPLGAWADDASLGNAYAYVGNSPLRGVDPSGLWCWSCAWDSFTNAVTSTVNVVSNVIGDVVDAAAQTWDAVSTAVGTGLSDAWQAAADVASDVGSDIVNGMSIVGNAVIDGVGAAGNYVQDKCFDNWGDVVKCGLVAASAAVLVVGAVATAPVWAIGAATAVMITAAVDCINGCLSDNWEAYAGSALAGGLFAGAGAAFTGWARIAMGSAQALTGDFAEQELSHISGDQKSWDWSKTLWSAGAGALGGRLGGETSLNSGKFADGSNNFAARFESVANSGNRLGWRSYRNYALGLGLPKFFDEGMDKILEKARPGGEWQDGG
jgi:RHS repeat-associated protein